MRKIQLGKRTAAKAKAAKYGRGNMSELSNVKITSSPHLRSSHTTQDIMLLVTVALLPAAGFGVYNFGLDALIVLLLTVAS